MKSIAIILLSLSCYLPATGNINEISDSKKQFLEIMGECMKNIGWLNDVTIRVYQGNELIEILPVQKKGRFSVMLAKNQNYTLEFEKEGFLTKRVHFSTHAPDEVKKVAPFEFAIVLIEKEKIAGVESQGLDFPAALIRYNPKSGRFEDDNLYTKKMILEQEVLIYESYLRKELMIN